MGAHTMSSLGHDPAAVAFFHPWAHQWTRWLVWLTFGWLATYFVVFGISWAVIWNQERSTNSGN